MSALPNIGDLDLSISEDLKRRGDVNDGSKLSAHGGVPCRIIERVIQEETIDPALLRAMELAEALELTPTNLQKVAKSTSIELAREAFVQWDLRRRARDKFVRAELLMFDREALEQSSHQAVASYHASLFPRGSEVADLTAGIGGDSIALSSDRRLTAFETDSKRFAMLSHNLRALGRTAELHRSDGLEWMRGRTAGYFFVDPSRREGGTRLLLPEQFSPNPFEIVGESPRQRLVAMKLSPMLPDSSLSKLGRSIEFVSFGGECREALALLGIEARDGISAVHLESGERLSAAEPVEPTPKPEQYLYEADPAAIRADALGALCEEFALASLGDSNGYLTSSSLVQSVWLRSYRVLYEGPGDERKTRAALKELDSSTPVVKQRHAGIDPIKLRRTWKLSGSRQVAVACYLVGKSVRHVVLESV